MSVVGTMSYALQAQFERALGAGLQCLRLNSGFGGPALLNSWAEYLTNVQQGRRTLCKVYLDLGGYKVRLDNAESAIRLPGDAVMISAGADAELTVKNPKWLESLRVGDLVLVGDGETALEVVSSVGDRLTVEVTRGGRIESGRGLTVQGRSVSSGATSSDLTSLERLVRDDLVDGALVSFVEGPADLAPVRAILGRSEPGLELWAKVETAKGVENIEAIAAMSDGIVIGRGDLALSADWIELYELVDATAQTLAKSGTPWWIATECLIGAEEGGLPTRAEMCDLAHWVRSGATGILLSHETVFAKDIVNPIACAKLIFDRYYSPRGAKP